MASKTAEKKRKKRKETAKVLTILDGIARIPFRKSDKKGFDAEDEVLKQCRYFQKRKIIKTARLSERFSADDQAGKDLVIGLLTGKEICISITATYHRQDAIRAQKQGNIYLPVGQFREDIIREKLLKRIIDGYFSDLDIDQMRRIFSNLPGKKSPGKLERLQRFLHIKTK